MEKILFEDKLNRTVQIIMIDYLTAEKYAEDFHCLQSLTRSSKVQKVNFMPGFTNKTGGLIIDSEWEHFCDYQNNKTLLCFTYDRNWDALANACKKSNYIEKVLIAPGKGFDSLKKSFSSDLGFNTNSKNGRVKGLKVVSLDRTYYLKFAFGIKVFAKSTKSLISESVYGLISLYDWSMQVPG